MSHGPNGNLNPTISIFQTDEEWLRHEYSLLLDSDCLQALIETREVFIESSARQGDPRVLKRDLPHRRMGGPVRDLIAILQAQLIKDRVPEEYETYQRDRGKNFRKDLGATRSEGEWAKIALDGLPCRKQVENAYFAACGGHHPWKDVRLAEMKDWKEHTIVLFEKVLPSLKAVLKPKAANTVINPAGLVGASDQPKYERIANIRGQMEKAGNLDEKDASKHNWLAAMRVLVGHMPVYNGTLDFSPIHGVPSRSGEPGGWAEFGYWGEMDVVGLDGEVLAEELSGHETYSCRWVCPWPFLSVNEGSPDLGTSAETSHTPATDDQEEDWRDVVAHQSGVLQEALSEAREDPRYDYPDDGGSPAGSVVSALMALQRRGCRFSCQWDDDDAWMKSGAFADEFRDANGGEQFVPPTRLIHVGGEECLEARELGWAARGLRRNSMLLADFALHFMQTEFCDLFARLVNEQPKRWVVTLCTAVIQLVEEFAKCLNVREPWEGKCVDTDEYRWDLAVTDVLMRANGRSTQETMAPLIRSLSEPPPSDSPAEQVRRSLTAHNLERLAKYVLDENAAIAFVEAARSFFDEQGVSQELSDAAIGKYLYRIGAITGWQYGFFGVAFGSTVAPYFDDHVRNQLESWLPLMRLADKFLIPWECVVRDLGKLLLTPEFAKGPLSGLPMYGA